MLINGEFRSAIPPGNRGLAYGDGLFETIALRQGRAPLLERHLRRLARGCARLGIPDCRSQLEKDLECLAARLSDYGVLKIIVTRGAGGRGYSVRGCGSPERILTLHPAPDYGASRPQAGIHAFVCRQRLARQPALAGIKHLNRLEQVLASAEWPEGDERVLEGVMLDSEGWLVEGTRSNLFWAAGGRLYTPSLTHSGVAGIAREILLEGFGGDAVIAEQCPLETLARAEEVFFCNSVFGIWPVTGLRCEPVDYRFEAGSWTQRARALFDAAMARN